MKTGALIECSVTLGAIASKKDIDNFLYNLVSTFGRDIGLLFQIRDDFLVFGVLIELENLLGQILRKKKSLPIILSLSSKINLHLKKLMKYCQTRLEQEDVNDVWI